MNFVKPKFWDKNKISFFSILLLPVNLIIKFASFLNRFLVKSKKFNTPIICVGNIYLGGTGKTPLCIEIFSILKELNMNPAFIRKKYDSFQDEVELLKKTGTIYQNKKRTKAIEEAIKNKSNIIILDDGFQDYTVNKNFSIICFNEKQWIGNGMTIPSGPLRETLFSLKRADCVVINGKKNLDIENKILNKNKKIKIFYTNYSPENVDKFKNKKVIAFAGIGNPENFFDLLEQNNIKIIEKIKYPDHYNYTEKELKNLINKSNENDAILLTTEKDYLRINTNLNKKINYLSINVKIKNRDLFVEEIKKII